MAKRARITENLILFAELSGHYKPDDELYLTMVDLLNLDIDDVSVTRSQSCSPRFSLRGPSIILL